MKVYNRLALSTLVLTLCMITLGGVVHNTASSLACPDWPLCFGQVFPKMEGGVAIEHSHRLLGALIGLLCIGLFVISARFQKDDPKLYKVSAWTLALVIFQGVLGGVTVKMQISPIVSTLHLGFSQIFMGCLLWLWMRSRKNRVDSQKSAAAITGQEVPASVRKWLAIAVGVLFVQMLLGAAIRHGGAGVACGLGSNALFLCADDPDARSLWPMGWPARFHMLHRFGAVIAAAFVIGGTLPFLKWVKRTAPHLKKLRLLVVSAHALVVFQIILGFLAVLGSLAIVPVTLHLVTASLLCFVLLSLNFLAAGRITT